MNKEETLESINKAIESHKNQMQKIEAMIDGAKVNNPTAVSKTECAFGKWLYNEDNRIQKILGSQFYNNVENLHSQWHLEYKRIFDIFQNTQKKGFFSKMIGSGSINSMEQDKARLYHSELLDTTENLLKALESSQRRISALSDTKFI